MLNLSSLNLSSSLYPLSFTSPLLPSLDPPPPPPLSISHMYFDSLRLLFLLIFPLLILASPLLSEVLFFTSSSLNLYTLFILFLNPFSRFPFSFIFFTYLFFHSFFIVLYLTPPLLPPPPPPPCPHLPFQSLNTGLSHQSSLYLA